MRDDAHLVEEVIRLVAAHGQVQIDEHTGIIVGLQLLAGVGDLRIGAFQRLGHIGVERNVAVLHFTVEEGEHIDERHGVIGKTADDLAVIAAVGGIGRVEKLRDLIVEVGQLGKLPRRQRVGQHIAAHGLDVGKAQRGVDLVVCPKLIQQLLFRRVIPCRDHNGDHIRRAERLVHQIVRDLLLRALGRLQIAEAVDIRAVIRKEHGDDDDRQKNRRNDLLCRIGKPADERNFGNEILVPRCVNFFAEEHQKARHEEEHREQREENGLDQADAEVKAQTELHKEHRDQAADRRQAAAADLRHGLAQSDNDGLAGGKLFVLFFIAVAENDRVIHRQGQLQHDGNGV